MLAAVVATSAVLAGCSSQGGAQDQPAASTGGGGGGTGQPFTIAMITHEAPGDTFWDKVRAGAEQAAKNDGVELKYSNDPDSTRQATLVQNAIDSKVDGIAATLASPDAVGPALVDRHQQVADEQREPDPYAAREGRVGGHSSRSPTATPIRTSHHMRLSSRVA